MVLSQTAEYALQAVLHLAARPPSQPPARVWEIAAALEIPENYLSKILHTLARGGVLESVRGRRGGFRLAGPADQLAIVRVVAPFDRMGDRRRCLLGHPHCADETACAAHHEWKSVARGVETFFRDTTVGDLVKPEHSFTPTALRNSHVRMMFSPDGRGRPAEAKGATDHALEI